MYLKGNLPKALCVSDVLLMAVKTDDTADPQYDGCYSKHN